MRRLISQRWFRITAFFALLNTAGLLILYDALHRSSATLSVEYFSPQGETGIETTVTLRFNQPMVPPEQIGKPVQQKGITFTPDISGNFLWDDDRTLSFRPAQKLPPATPYVAKLQRTMSSLWNATLPKDATFSFNTPPLRLETIKQTDFFPDGRVTLALTFNDTVAPEEVANHLTLTDKTGRKIEFSKHNWQAVATVEMRIPTFHGDTLVAKLSRGLRGTGGPLGLETDQIRTVALDREVKIHEVDARAETEGNCIHVTCSQEIDSALASSFIQIDPNIPFGISTTYEGFLLHGAFESHIRYRIRFLKGLKGTRGQTLPQETVRTVVFPDRPPTLRFKTQGFYLSSRGNLAVPLETVNVQEASVSIERIYDNNLVYHLRHSDSWRPPEGLGHILTTKKYTIKGKPNQPHITPIRLGELLPEITEGLYVLTAAKEGEYGWGTERQLVMITDLGITTKQSPTDMVVWVNRLSATEPVAGATVTVLTRSNQKIAKGTTNAEGLVRFTQLDSPAQPESEPAPRRGRSSRHQKTAPKEDNRTPYVVIVKKGKDIAFLELGKTARDDSPFDISGRPYLRKGYDAFVYADRGIYRPGEKAHLRTIVRTPDMNLPGEFPIQFHILRPDGRTFKTIPAKLSSHGSAEVQVDFPVHALTGRYTTEVRLPQGEPAIGTLSFQVEDFMPDRMKAEITAEDRRYRADEEIQFKVKASHLFGAPASGRRVEARYELIPSDFTFPEAKGYRFTDIGKPFAPVRNALEAAQLDEQGEHTFTIKLPDDLKPPSALTLLFTATVYEVGGRSVTTSLSRPVDVYAHYLGLKKEQEAYAEIGNAERFLCQDITPNGSPVESADVEVAVYKRIWNTVLKQDEDGRFRYQSEQQEVKTAQGSCTVSASRGEFTFTPREVGEYLIRFRDKKSGVSSSTVFYCSGEGYVPWNMEKPDQLELSADKKVYKPGETARILVKSPFKGRILLSIEGDRHHLTRTATMNSNTQEFTFAVDRSFGTNVYCSATVIREIKPGAPWTVHRAYGIIPLFLDPKPFKLQIDIGAPSDIRPGVPFAVPLRVRDADGKGRQAEVTLAVVDEGICQLTRYATPDPWSHFTAKRRLGVVTSDAYSFLMPEMDKKKIGSDSEEGGDDEGYDPRLMNPVRADRVRSISIWKSQIETGPDGEAEVILEIPPFSGQLRLMVVAGTVTQFGMAEQTMIVKQPLMIQTSYPRFLAPGDEFIIPATIFNHSRMDGTVRLSIESSPALPVLTPPSLHVEVERGHEHTVNIRARAPEFPGILKFKITASLGQEQATDEVEIPVRPPATLHSVVGVGLVPADTTDRISIAGNWVPQTDRYSLSFSSLPTFKLGPGLRYLARYPYGCVEQTTSGAFPLLYLSDLGEMIEPDMFSKEQLSVYVEAGISRLLSMQTRRGGFSMWPGYSQPYPWGSVYATHFLVEAKKAGYPVPEENLESALRYLNRELSDNDNETNDLAVKAYACFVLAAADKPNASWTYRLNEQMEKLPVYSRFHVMAALTRLKDHELVSAFMSSQKLPPVTTDPDTGGVLHSSVREAAILLSTYMDIDPSHAHVPVLVQRLESSTKDLRWGTTQENAFALMALGKYIRHVTKEKPDFQAEVFLGDQRLASFTHRDKMVLTPEKIGGRTLSVTVKGTGTLYYMWTATGIPVKTTVPEHDHGLKVRRRFLTREGKPLDTRRLKQGTISVVELTIENDRPVENVVVSDLLPAGLEIENPRIATGDANSWLKENSFHPARIEMRDDRLLVFADLESTEKHVYRYIVRAVTQGTFVLPPVSAECMYHPGLSSLNGNGTIEVIDGRK